MCTSPSPYTKDGQQMHIHHASCVYTHLVVAGISIAIQLRKIEPRQQPTFKQRRMVLQAVSARGIGAGISANQQRP